MMTELTITDLTNMHAGRICVAGVNDKGESIRPQFRRQHFMREWCTSGGQVIRPFSKIQLDLIERKCSPPHTEDWIIADDCIKLTGEVEKAKRQYFLEKLLDPDVESIFGAKIQHIKDEGTFTNSGEGNRSLGTIRVKRTYLFSNKCFEDNRHDCRISFLDAADKWYRLKIVDLTFQTYVDHLRSKPLSAEEVSKMIDRTFYRKDIYMRIGLSRGWGMHPERCYLQINGVYTFPDYLEGKCFTDFEAPTKDNEIVDFSI
ncbi:MAG TPA: hypothetical protein DIW44_03900 [Anaerolineaceae bacterium]|nr:hypothetical protein [Anaerolineaceae bacterium]